MVSSTLCPAVHILGSQNVYGRAEGIADHYWPWAVFFKILIVIIREFIHGFRKLSTKYKTNTDSYMNSFTNSFMS